MRAWEVQYNVPTSQPPSVRQGNYLDDPARGNGRGLPVHEKESSHG